MLQTWPDLPEDQWDRAAAHYLAQPALALGDGQQAEIRAETLGVLHHPEFGKVFASGSRAEVPLSAVIGGWVISGHVDRLAITDSEILIFDYKTKRIPPCSPEDVN